MKNFLVLFFFLFIICRLAEGFHPGTDENTNSIVHFPCPFSPQIKDHPNITIWGENHRSLLHMSRTQQLRKAGVSGNIYVGVEGMVYGDPTNKKYWEYSYNADEQSRLFGYEDGVSYGLTMALVNYMKLYRGINDLHGERPFLKESKINFFVNFSEPYIQRVWRQIDRPFPNPEDEELALLADKIVSNEDLSRMSTKEYIDFFRKEIKVNEIASQDGRNEAFIRLSRTLVTTVASSFQKEYSGDESFPDMSSYYGLIENPGGIEEEKRFMIEIGVNWRNFKMAENLAKIYCSALEEKKDLVVIVGGLHVRGLVDILRQSSNGFVGVFGTNYKSIDDW